LGRFCMADARRSRGIGFISPAMLKKRVRSIYSCDTRSQG
jgi:hypothetical protein